MYFFHKIFGFIFNIFSKFPVKNNQISFICDSNESFKGNLDYIRKEFEKRGNFKFNFYFKDQLSLNKFYNLATSKYVFLDDNFFPMAFMNFNSKSTVVQLWHAPGAFKKFGASSGDENEVKMLKKISNKTDYLIVSSDCIIDSYSEAFQINKDKTKPLGLPRSDYFFENNNVDNLRQDFDNKYPQAKGKKLVLYAPTFRDNDKYNNVLDFLNLDDFNSELGEDYILLLRLHPKKFLPITDSNLNYIDCTGFKNSEELLLISDILITDYSSIMIEFAILNKPIIFFTFDYDDYMSKDRGFYFDFKNTVPGVIVDNSKDLINSIKNEDFNKDKIQPFLETQFNELNGQASKRVVDFLLNNEVKNE